MKRDRSADTATYILVVMDSTAHVVTVMYASGGGGGGWRLQ